MGAWAGQPNIGGMQPQQQGQPQQGGLPGGDVPPFDLPPPPNVDGIIPVHKPLPTSRPAPQMSNDDYLRQLYQQEMGRDPDQGGMDYWRGQMAGGMSPEQVRQMFDQSQEGQAYNQQPPRFSNDPRYPHMHPEIAGALRLAQPNMGTELNDVISAPRERLTPMDGTPPAMGDVRYYGNKVLPPRPNDDYLRSLYQRELGREADQGGLDYWRQQMAGGMSPEQIRNIFDQSQEGQAYRQRPMNPNSPEIQDALRLARGLPVF